MKRNGKRQTSLTQSREDAKVSRLVTSLCASAPLREIDTEFVSRKALAAGSSVFHAGSSVTPYETPAASALPLREARP